VILGTGCDIVDIRRIQGLIERQGQRFLDRVFTPYEQTYCLAKNQKIVRIRADSPRALTSTSTNSFSKMFAAKEAAVKAIGNTDNIGWHDLEIKHEATGRPTLHLHGNAHDNLLHIIAQKLGNTAETQYIRYYTHLSLSDEPPYAIANVILELIHNPNN
jgi:holo-[acyl-carrier protein] synthase